MANFSSQKLLWAIALNASISVFAQNGPGGIGHTDGATDLNLWIRSGYGLTIPSGNNVSDWADQSGHANHVSQDTTSYQPQQSTNAINGYTTIIFDGTDDVITTGAFSSADTESAYSIFTVWKYIGSYPKQRDAIFASADTYSNGTVQISSTGNTAADSFSCGGKLIAAHSQLSNYNITSVTRSSSNTMNSWLNEASSTSKSISAARATEFYLYKMGVNRNGVKFLNGELAETIVFYKEVSEIERIIINNYLSAKFDIGLTSNDYYTQDNSGSGNFDHHVAGIGQSSDGSSHSTSKGSGIVQMSNPSDLQNGEFLFWGEDTQSSSYGFTTTSEYYERQNSTWRISKQNDVGSVTVSVNAADLDLSGKQSCATLYLVVSNSSTFSSKTTYAMSLSSGVYSVNNVSFSDDDYFTFEYFDKVVIDGSSFYNGSGTSSAPGTSDECYKLLVKSTADGSLDISENAKVREVEVESGGILAIDSNTYLSISNSINNNGTINICENSSLIQTGTGSDNNSGTGTYNVKRAGNNSAYYYNIWSSPIQSAPLSSVFNNSNPCDIYVFDKDLQTWKYDYTAGYTTTCNGNSVTFTASDVILGGDGNMDIGGGYFVPGNPTALKTYNGTINNGDLQKAISITNLGNPGGTDWADDDWNLLGNPYPSALNATAFWNENAVNNSRITDALYFWDEADTTGGYNQNSDYASWNLSGGVNSGNSSTIPGGNIASGQGFWVVANANTNVVFNNSMRTSSNSQFFKSQNLDQHNAWISFTSPSGYRNNILIGYNQNTTDSVDAGYDAHKLVGNAHVRFASYIGTDEFVIQSIAPLNIGDSKTIPIVVFSDEYGTHHFNEYKRENLPNNVEIYLKDKYLGLEHNLVNGPYTVDLNPNTEYKSRFELLFKYKVHQSGGGSGSKGGGTATSIEDYYNNHFELTTGSGIITIYHPNGITGYITLTDISGRTLYKSQYQLKQNSIQVNWSHFIKGIYFISVQNGSHRIYLNQIVKSQ
ncbi:T9SS type A sorting domain-containing protein [bacterium SCSIO 12643]|nr:T9SS type A sorting domain-containing protein [bacterium SCSIO 12643]